VPTLVRIGIVVLEKNSKMKTSNRQTDGQWTIRKLYPSLEETLVMSYIMLAL
jgi:hypothetical protein